MKKSSRSSKVTFVSEKPEKNVKPVFIFVLFVAMLLSAVYLYIRNGNEEKQKKQFVANSTPSVSDQKDESSSGVPETLLDKVKKHLVVSETDIPYIATITNIDLVKDKNPEFYADATDGDKVIVWKDRAVIYSESKDRIVSVATAKPLLISGSENTGTSASSSTSTSTLSDVEQQMASTTIEIRNGSRKNGAAKVLKQQLETLGLNVSKVGDTGKVYEGTQIIDLSSGKSTEVLDLVAKSTSGTVATVLPEGERASTAQVLILIGR